MPAKILIVDDQVKVAKSIALNIEDWGHEARLAHNGGEALKQLQVTTIDMVLLDLSLGTESGLEVLMSIKKSRPKCPVVMITGFGTIKHAIHAMKCGALDFLEKPIDFDSLKQLIQKALHGDHIEVDNDKGNQRQDQSATPSIITCDPFLGELIQKAKKLADSDIPVLISGESGTGKELMAHLIHNNSQCQSREFFQINCASFQDNLLESELFGHVKGAFTGATKDKKGIFELADRSSIHLDEIGDMTLATQAKVLRVLQEGDLKKVGAERVSKVKIRVIASTNKNLAQEVEAGRFRRDLYYRLKGAHLQLPPLKERRCDISQLCEYFVSRHRSSPLTINPGVIDMLKEHHWPGNIRELSHVLHYACTVCQGETLGVEDLPPELFEKQDLVPQSTLETKPTQPKNTPQEHGLLDEAERLAIEDAYRKNGFNKKKTALELGISRGTLYSRLKKYNLG